MRPRQAAIFGFFGTVVLLSMFWVMQPCWQRNVILLCAGICIGLNVACWIWNDIVDEARAVLVAYRGKLKQLDTMINEKKITGPF